MQKIIYTIALFLGFSAFAIGQSELIIEPGPPGVINAAIAADTNSLGERNDPNRVYVLRRNFPYILTGTIEFTDFHLRIKAEEGEGARPFIIVDSGAEPVSQIIRMFGSSDITLDGLHISGQDILGAYNNRVVRINSDSSQVFINDCLFEQIGQAAVRVQGDNPKIYITNSILRNIGRPFNPNNGRVFDNRGVPIDTLWMQNNVVYNVSQRIYRSGGGSFLNWARFDQNTIWGTGVNGIDFAEIKDLEFTNNIYANGRFVGAEAERQDTAETALYWMTVDTFDATVSNYLVSHNNFYTDQEILDVFPLQEPDGDTRVTTDGAYLDLQLQAAQTANGTTETNINEPLDFADDPIINTQFIVASVLDTPPGGEIPGAEPWDMSDLTLDMNLSAIGTGDVERYTQVHDFTYSMSAMSATAGTNGQPIGANMELITSVPDIFVDNRILYYPNPVKDVLVVQNLEEVNLSRVAVFNITGQQLLEVTDIDNAALEINTAQFEAGTYILSVMDKAGNVSSRKFMKQ
ncbi:MAG: T9SS type A sorting domain-containing protein [Bacteroidota bacterium]